MPPFAVLLRVNTMNLRIGSLNICWFSSLWCNEERGTLTRTPLVEQLHLGVTRFFPGILPSRKPGGGNLGQRTVYLWLYNTALGPISAVSRDAPYFEITERVISAMPRLVGFPKGNQKTKAAFHWARDG